MDITTFLDRVNALIINPIIVLAFAIALLVFFWGIVQFISSETTDKSRAEGQKKILYGIIGMFIMFSVYGIIGLILDTFSIPKPDYLFQGRP